MAGGAATGVLQKGQFEVMSSYKYTRSDKFLTGDVGTFSYFDNISSNYLYLKTDYGISDRLTLSVSSGYYLNRTITEFPDTLNKGGKIEIGEDQHHVSSSGIGDIIVFPRYNVFTQNRDGNKTELALGMGLKIPVGHHNDSNFVGYSRFLNTEGSEPFIDSTEIWNTSPPTVQATTGSNDLMFYGFYSKNYEKQKLRFFASALYIHRGWNSLGLKFGDYASVGVFAGTTVFKKMGLLAQLKGEWVGTIKTHELLDVLSAYNIEQESTGSKMVSFVPQVSYSFKNGVNVFATTDIPLYQYMKGTQVASQLQVTAGVSYRFFIEKKYSIPHDAFTSDKYRVGSIKVWGACGMCKETIETNLSKLDGVVSAIWDVEKKMLEVHYNGEIVSEDGIKVELARIGYDTETHKASDEAYKGLHECCQYDRS